jgi:ribosomal protein S6--L-glutamate ligase
VDETKWISERRFSLTYNFMQIVVLSRNAALYSTQSIVNAARKRGHQVRVLDHMQCDLVIEKGNPAIYYHSERIRHVEAVIPRIGSSATDYGAVVVRQFMKLGAFSSLNPVALITARNKISCLQVLANHGLDVPKSVVSNNFMVISEMLDLIDKYPMILKLASGTHGLGVILSESKRSAEAMMEAFYKVKQRVILQEFIEESKGCDVRVLIVDDKIVGAMERRAQKGEFRSNLHRGANSFITPLSDIEQKAALKSARVLGLSIAGVDMLRSKRGPLVLEVNASPGLEGIETTTHVDIASKIIQFVERNSKPAWRAYK